MPTMIVDFIDIVTEWLQGLITVLSASLEGVVSLFYIAETGFTFAGTMLLFGLAFGFMSLALSFIIRLIRK